MELRILHLNNGVSTAEVLAEIALRHCRAAALWNLISLIDTPFEGSENTDLPIVALETAVQLEDGQFYSPCLEWNGCGWDLSWCLRDAPWYPSYRFLALPI